MRPSPGPGRGYRPDVDGLRAVAVLAVIAHHFSADALPGGFLGVDIFFVISGYVITLSLLERPRGSLGDFLLAFYVRRIKRIVPPLVLMIAVTVVVGSLFMPSGTGQHRSSMEAGVAAAFGVSNIYFYLNAVDYFGSSAELNLFTHTWSLGVEEQFYLIFPLLFWALIGRRALMAAVAGLASISFAAWLWRSNVAPDEAYFSVFTRFWELAVGCAIALFATRRAPGFMVYPSLTAIAAALIMPPSMMLYSTTLVVAGTAGMISASREGQYLYRALTLGPVVFIGLVSYSLYLWHWPVLAIARWSVGVTPWTAVPLAATMFALAVASYHAIERPLRRARWSSLRPVTIGYGILSAGAASALAIFLSQGWIGNPYQGQPAPLIAAGVASLKDKKFHNGEMQWDPEKCVLDTKDTDFAPVTFENCLLTGATNTDRTFLVVGNSFSAALYEMYAHLSDTGFGQVIATSSWGASQIHTLPNGGPWAAANDHYWKVVIPSLISRMKSGDVILMLNDNAGYFAQQPQSEVLIGLLEEGLSEIAEDALSKGIGVVYLTQFSLVREAKCTPDMARAQWVDRSLSLCKLYDRDYTQSRFSMLTSTLAGLQNAYPNFRVLDLSPIYCDENLCGMINPAGVPLYRDESSHPSVEANILAQPYLIEAIERLTPSESAGLGK